jgi:hypothetical protein
MSHQQIDPSAPAIVAQDFGDHQTLAEPCRSPASPVLEHRLLPPDNVRLNEPVPHGNPFRHETSVSCVSVSFLIIA